MHQNKVVDQLAEYALSVDRTTSEKLWQSAICFYKNAMIKPVKLFKEPVIHYNGEAGAYSGALQREFFEDTIYQGNLYLFEGEDDRRIVKKDWGLEVLCEIFGMIVAHSVLQEGPGFPCLCPCMFQYLSTEKSDECFPVKEDIPLNIATHDLLTFIEEVCNAYIYIYIYILYLCMHVCMYALYLIMHPFLKISESLDLSLII